MLTESNPQCAVSLLCRSPASYLAGIAQEGYSLRLKAKLHDFLTKYVQAFGGLYNQVAPARTNSSPLRGHMTHPLTSPLYWYTGSRLNGECARLASGCRFPQFRGQHIDTLHHQPAH